MDQGTEKREEVTTEPAKLDDQGWQTKWRTWYRVQRDKLLKEEASMEAQIRMIRRLMGPADPKKKKTIMYIFQNNLSALATWIWANLKLIRILLSIANKHEKQITGNEMALAKLTAC